MRILIVEMRLHDPIPSFDGASGWIGKEVRAEQLVGRPLLIHLWSSACDACRDQMPAVRRWEEEFGPAGLQIVGVLSRSTEEESNEEAIDFARQAGLDHPIALDSDEAPLARRLGAHFVPTYYLFDARGQLRHRQAGYDAERGTETAIRRILEEAQTPSWQH